MIRIYLIFLFIASICLPPKYSEAQSLPVVSFGFDNDMRVLQLQGKLPEDHSLTIRPIRFSRTFSADSLYAKIAGKDQKSLRELNKTFFNGKGKVSLLPFRNIIKYASHHPYGWSDGALMSAKGFQQVSSLGVYAALGPLEIQLAPEFLYAENGKYETNELYGNSRPYFGYKRVYAGQSRVSLNLSAFSMGVSTENIWWGPGQFTGLMMTNHAPGFLHLNFQTRRPLKTPIGNFEWQLVSGKLTAHKSLPEEVFENIVTEDPMDLKIKTGYYSKYLNALNITYSPAFIKGLTVGFSRSYASPNFSILEEIQKKVGFVRTYLPVFDIVFKQKRIDGTEDSLKWNQLASFYARLQLKKAKAEVYFEYGWNDSKVNLRDLMMSTVHSSSFLTGIKKIVELNKNRVLDFSIEYNQLSQSPDYLVRDAGNWYLHGFGAHFSNFGEILGSGTSYGADVFTFSLDIRESYRQFGFRFEKINRFQGISVNRWTDYAISLSTRQKIKKFLFNINLSGVQSKNYAWMRARDRFNVIGMMGVQYFW